MIIPPLFDDGVCTDSCGYVAAIVAALAYGTYGVPIKATKKLPIHPLVFQSYKTCTMFLLSWFVLCTGVPYSFSVWGIVSGLLWVLGGMGGIVAVRYAGMAVAVGTWASVMICVNFVWGILVFEEPVANIYGTVFAFVLLTIGLVGMSKYSEPTPIITPITTNAAAFSSSSSSSTTMTTKSSKGSINRNMSNKGEKLYTTGTTTSNCIDPGLCNHQDNDTVVPPPPPPSLSSSDNDDKYHDDDYDNQVEIENDDEEEEEELLPVYPGSAVVQEMKKIVAVPWGSFQNLLEVRSYSSLLACEKEALEENYDIVDDPLEQQQQQHQLEWGLINSTGNNYGSVDLVETMKDNRTGIQSNPNINHSSTASLLRTGTGKNNSKSASTNYNYNTGNDDNVDSTIEVCGMLVTKRTFGIFGAVFNGIMTGTSFIPVHYAKKFGFGGAHYMISYAIGAFISNIVLWILYIGYIYIYRSCTCPPQEEQNYRHHSSSSSSYQQLQQQQQQTSRSNLLVLQPTATTATAMMTMITKDPTFHTRVHNTYKHLPKLYFKQLWFPGFMAGLFLTTAMFGTLLSVTYLGQGVGNSLIQAKILVSGMWGIFWYKEINQRERIRNWFLSASFTIAGILWLSYERLEVEKVNAHYVKL